MPACYRCQRIQATCEVRRTPRGWLCKDNKPGSTCARLTKTRNTELRKATA